MPAVGYAMYQTFLITGLAFGEVPGIRGKTFFARFAGYVDDIARYMAMPRTIPTKGHGSVEVSITACFALHLGFGEAIVNMPESSGMHPRHRTDPSELAGSTSS